MRIKEKIGNYFATRRERAKERKLRREQLEREFQAFLEETKPFAPYSPKNPDATLYRHAWRRAEVLTELSKSLPEVEFDAFREVLGHFSKRSAKEYYRVAPTNAYGTVRLEMSGKQARAIAKQERARRRPKPDTNLSPTACIYIAICSRTQLRYIGQTRGAPELRWAQHRQDGTGPFKKGAIDPQYRIVEMPVNPKELNERESYFIGLYDSFENGLNENRGYDARAYDRGCEDRKS